MSGDWGGRRFGELSPAEKRAAAKQAMSTLAAELTANAAEIGRIMDEALLAAPEVREADARAYPHDEDCPRCGRRQWGLGPLTTDPLNPSDAEQETCGACGYRCTGPEPEPAVMPEFLRAGPGHWLARNNAYTIRTDNSRDFVLRDGHGGFLGRFGSKPAAVSAAREDAIVKRGRS